MKGHWSHVNLVKHEALLKYLHTTSVLSFPNANKKKCTSYIGSWHGQNTLWFSRNKKELVTCKAWPVASQSQMKTVNFNPLMKVVLMKHLHDWALTQQILNKISLLHKRSIFTPWCAVVKVKVDCLLGLFHTFLHNLCPLLTRTSQLPHHHRQVTQRYLVLGLKRNKNLGHGQKLCKKLLFFCSSKFFFVISSLFIVWSSSFLFQNDHFFTTLSEI